MSAPKAKIFSITNGERGTVLAERAKLASSLVDRFFGLMGRRRIEEGGGLLLTKSGSIHSFFMRFRFDAVFVDQAVGANFFDDVFGCRRDMFCFELAADGELRERGNVVYRKGEEE